MFRCSEEVACGSGAARQQDKPQPFFWAISTSPISSVKPNDLCLNLDSSMHHMSCVVVPVHSSPTSNYLCGSIQVYTLSTVQKYSHYGNMVVVTGHVKWCEPTLQYLIESNKFKHWF